MELSKRVRGLRYAKGWGPDELASRAKISRTALYQIERGTTNRPQAATLRRISRALGVSLEALMDPAPIPAESEDNQGAAPAVVPRQIQPSDRVNELIDKFRVLLASPLADGVARIVEESYRLLPIIPPPGEEEPTGNGSARAIAQSRRGRTQFPSEL
jgi:transcriptional regulator with XRE-family HTH domain